MLKTKAGGLVGLVAVGMLALCSCTDTKKEEKPATMPSSMTGKLPPGAIVVAAAESSATVESVDLVKRTITLKNAQGVTATYKCGPEVKRLNEIKPGDRIKAQVVEAVAVYVRKGTGEPQMGAASTVTLNPKNARPGVVVTDTKQITAKVDAVDAAKHLVTVTGPLGNSRLLQVNPDVDLSDVKVGDNVVLQYTEGVALMVE